MTCSPSTVYDSVENVTFSGWEVLSIFVSESNRIFVAFSESVLLNVQLFSGFVSNILFQKRIIPTELYDIIFGIAVFWNFKVVWKIAFPIYF